MIERIASDAPDTTVTKLSGVQIKIKFLNFLASGIEILKMDQQAVASATCNVVAGDIFRDSTGAAYTVFDMTRDYFRAECIRKCLTLITCNNAVTVLRPTPIDNGQGGIQGHTDAPIHTAIPCKIGTLSAVQNKKLDVNLDRFTMLLSAQYPVQLGDIIQFASFYSNAKVEDVKRDNPDVQEVIFDKDPRWT